MIFDKGHRYNSNIRTSIWQQWKVNVQVGLYVTLHVCVYMHVCAYTHVCVRYSFLKEKGKDLAHFCITRNLLQ